MGTWSNRIKSVWNAFAKQEELRKQTFVLDYGVSSSRGNVHRTLQHGNEGSILASIYTRIAVDTSDAEIKHIRVDDDNRFVTEMSTKLNDCLTWQPNIDQSPRSFRLDLVLTLLDDGVAAIVPVDTTIDPTDTSAYDIETLRVGRIVQWFPKHVTVNVYDENDGQRKDVTLPKSFVAIVENPLFLIMNAPNSTLRRLINKLRMLDSVDEAASSGRLDLLIQLPYIVKGESKRKQAKQRLEDIEFQMANSPYGIAYIDGTEKVTQLNRPAENNLLKQIEYLTQLLYTQLGLTEEVMNGTADEATMLNYNNRTIEPLLTAIVESMRRAFITKTGRSQKQTINYFRDPFNLVPISVISEIADKFTRNEILTSNEIRGIIGRKPSTDPKADELVNSNMPIQDTSNATNGDSRPLIPPEGDSQNET